MVFPAEMFDGLCEGVSEAGFDEYRKAYPTTDYINAHLPAYQSEFCFLWFLWFLWFISMLMCAQIRMRRGRGRSRGIEFRVIVDYSLLGEGNESFILLGKSYLLDHIQGV